MWVEALQDAFICRIASPTINLLENKTLDLQTAYDQASSLDLIHKNDEAYVALIPSSAVWK